MSERRSSCVPEHRRRVGFGRPAGIPRRLSFVFPTPATAIDRLRERVWDERNRRRPPAGSPDGAGPDRLLPGAHPVEPDRVVSPGEAPFPPPGALSGPAPGFLV